MRGAMRYTFILAFMLNSVFVQPGLALRVDCSGVWSTDTYDGTPNTDDAFIVLGQIDDDRVFKGVIIGPSEPDQPFTVQLANPLFIAPDPIWGGGARLPINIEFIGEIFRSESGDYFVHMDQYCPSGLEYEPTLEDIAHIRSCMQGGSCQIE